MIKMKKLFNYLSIITLFFACSQPPSYKITGEITGQEGIIYLKQKIEGQSAFLDSTELVNGKFTFEGSVKGPEQYALTFNNYDKNKIDRIPFIIENSAIFVNADINNLYFPEIKISGSHSQDIMNNFHESIAPFNKEIRDLRKDYMADRKNKENRSERILAYSDKMKELNANIKAATYDFIKKNNISYAAAILASQLGHSKSADEIDEFIAMLDVSLMECDVVIGMKERAEAIRNVAVGKFAPDFTMNDVDGNPIVLSSLYGKGYLFVDFWASWCGPCRAENPHVVAAYNKFHDKGFEILGVSYDRNKDSWLAAIEKDQLPWLHVSDLKGWKNLTAKLYSISAIPANVLLDKEGKIIAKDLRSVALEEKLAELLD